MATTRRRARITLEFSIRESQDVDELRRALLEAFKFSTIEKMLGMEDEVFADVSRKFEIVEGLGGLA